MDELLSTFMTWQFIMFCLGIAAITFVVRKIVEFLILDNPDLPGSRKSKLWTDLLLPAGPVATGALIGLIAKQFPYPEGLHTASGRMFFGLVAGLLSGLVYRVIKSLLKAKLSPEDQANSSDDSTT